MKHLYTLFRATEGFKKETDQRECNKEKKAIATASADKDVLQRHQTVCTVETDWIEKIEKGLDSVEKAINEARQFILSRGEVVPIEKAKRISKDSVEHLARHSDMITREQEGEEIIPDKLYIMERLSDFAVYENRFLYKLLCYLNSFVTHRYNKILELTNTYRAQLVFAKEIAVEKRKILLDLRLDEERRDDKYLQENNSLKSVIERIELILKVVAFLLSTPIMQEVAKVPMLKNPIIKTNVLKMNKNFKAAMDLYDFVTAYEKDGFSTQTHTESLTPFSEETATEFAHSVMMTSFLAYKHALKIGDVLAKNFEAEEEARRAEERERLAEQLALLKKKIDESGEAPMEYMLMLEKYNRSLEADSAALGEAIFRIERLVEEGDRLRENVMQVEERLREAEEKALEADRIHKEQISLLNIAHEKKIDLIEAAHKEEIAQIETEKERQMQEKKEEICKLNDIINEERVTFLKRQEESEKRLKEEEEKAQKNAALQEQRYQEILSEKTVLEARINALRKQYNLISEEEDFTSQATFGELERQYKVFKNFFKEEWKKTKKKIRKQILKPEGQNEEN